VTAPRPGCWNKPRPTEATTYIAQAGWDVSYEHRLSGPIPMSREPVLIDIPHRMSTTCKYDKSATDPGCAGCHQVPAS